MRELTESSLSVQSRTPLLFEWTRGQTCLGALSFVLPGGAPHLTTTHRRSLRVPANPVTKGCLSSLSLANSTDRHGGTPKKGEAWV